MRTTLDLNDELMKRAKKAAAEKGTTLTGLIEDALREKLGRRVEKAAKRRKLHSFRADGLRPGVELKSTSALLDLLDDDAAP